MNPPKRALQFLRWFCREDYLEEIEGDLTEVFKNNMRTLRAKQNGNFRGALSNTSGRSLSSRLTIRFNQIHTTCLRVILKSGGVIF